MFNRYQYNSNVYQGVTNPRNSTSIITAIRRGQEGLSIPKFIVGGKGGSAGATFSIMKKATTYTLNIWKSKRFTIPAPFNILSIVLPLTVSINQNQIIIPYLDFDNGSLIVQGTTISSANYVNGENTIYLTPYDFAGNVHGTNNFCLQLNFTGSALIGVTLPISIQLETEQVG